MKFSSHEEVLRGFVGLDNDTKVLFPEGVEVVSREVLCYILKDEKGILHEETVVSVYLPDSVRMITDNCFRDFPNLWECCLNSNGSSLQFIGQFAFANCKKLHFFDVAQELRYIGRDAFVNTSIDCLRILDAYSKVDYISKDAFGVRDYIENRIGKEKNDQVEHFISGCNVGGVVDWA